MQKSTASPSAIVRSTDNDCVASQNNTIKKTATQTHTLICGRAGCPVVFIYDVDTNWSTVSWLVSNHSLVCNGGLYGLANSPPRSNTHDAQHVLCPRLAPANWGINSGNHNEAVASGRRPRRNEKQRKQELETDEYTEDVQPTSVRCRGCQKVIRLDKRSRYYPGLWDKHRGICPEILKIEKDKQLTGERDWVVQSNPEHSPPASSSDASVEESDEDEYRIMGFSTSNVRGA